MVRKHLYTFRFCGFLAVCLSLSACNEAPKAAAEKRSAPIHLVETTTLSMQPVDLSRERSGTLRAAKTVQIFSQEEGKIEKLAVQIGDQVNAGDLLIQLDNRLLNAQINRAEALRLKAEKEQARQQTLANKNLAPVQTLTQAETDLAVAKADLALLKTRLGYTQITAPISGVITQRLSEAGNIAERFSHLLTLEDTQTLILDLPVSERLLPYLEVGVAVPLQIDALPGQVFQGTVQRIPPTLDTSTRTGLVEVVLHPVPEHAKPGQLARTTLPIKLSPRLMVPFSALRHDAKGSYLFTLDAQKKAVRTPVTTGVRNGELIEISSGASVGTEVITRGFNQLKLGTTVKVISAGEAQ